MRAALRLPVLAAAALGAWLAAWAAAVALLGASPDFVPSPLGVAERLVWLWGHPVGADSLAGHLTASLSRFAGGFALAAAAGVLLGFAAGYFRAVDDFLNPVFEAMRYVPPIAWAPFSILWFGLGYGAQAFVIFVSALPPILINARKGVRSVNPRLIAAARTLGAPPATILLEVAAPSAAPLVVAGLRIGVATGWMALVAAEIVAGDGSRRGLGYLVLVGQQTLQPAVTIAAMAVIGLVGAAFDLAIRALGRRLTPW